MIDPLVIWLSVGHALLAIVQCWPWAVVVGAACVGPILVEQLTTRNRK